MNKVSKKTRKFVSRWTRENKGLFQNDYFFGNETFDLNEKVSIIVYVPETELEKDIISFVSVQVYEKTKPGFSSNVQSFNVPF